MVWQHARTRTCVPCPGCTLTPSSLTQSRNAEITEPAGTQGQSMAADQQGGTGDYGRGRVGLVEGSPVPDSPQGTGATQAQLLQAVLSFFNSFISNQGLREKRSLSQMLIVRNLDF